jgi:hypothetical protein
VPVPDVLYHHFIDLDYSPSDCDNNNYPIDLFVVPIHQQEHINDEFGLFANDDDEADLTLYGKMIIMIKLREKKTYTRDILIEYHSFYFTLQ